MPSLHIEGNQEEKSLLHDCIQTIEQIYSSRGLPRWLSSRESACLGSPLLEGRRCAFNPWVRKFPWRRKWQPILVFLPATSHGQKRLTGYNLWGHKELDMTYQLNHHHHSSRPDFKKLHLIILMLNIYKWKQFYWGRKKKGKICCSECSLRLCWQRSIQSKLWFSL